MATKGKLAFCLFLFFCNYSYSQVLNLAQAGVIEGGYGITPNLTGAMGIDVKGNFAYVSGFGNTLEILDITLPGAPVHKGSIYNGQNGASILRPNFIKVRNNYAYLSCTGGNSFEIIDVSDPANPVHKGSIKDGGGVPPYLGANYEFDIVGNYAYVTSQGITGRPSGGGLEIIDISNPANPKHAGSLIDGGGSAPYFGDPYRISVVGNYAYILSLGNGALQNLAALEIVDISTPSAPKHVGSILEGGAAFLNTATSISIVGHFAFITAFNPSPTTGNQDYLEVIDVIDPTNPVHAASLQGGGVDSGGHFLPPFFNGPFAMTVSGNYCYISNVYNGSNDYFEIVDITNRKAPVHAGGLVNTSMGGSRSLSVSGNYAYVPGSNTNTLTIIDVTNPAAPVQKAVVQNGTGGPIMRAPSSVYVSGNNAYVVSLANKNNAALEIVDVSNPNAPRHDGSLPATTTPGLTFASSVFASGNYAYVTSATNSALQVIDVTNNTLPVSAASIANGAGGAVFSVPTAVFVSGNYAYVLNSDDWTWGGSGGAGSLEIVDITNPKSPVHKGILHDGGGVAPFLFKPNSIFVSGSYAYITSSYKQDPTTGNPTTFSNTLEIVNISNPAAPVHAGFIKDGGGSPPYLVNPTGVFVSGNYAYIASSIAFDQSFNVVAKGNAFEIIDVTNPAAPVHKGGIKDGGSVAPFLYSPGAVFVSGNSAYITVGASTLSTAPQGVEVIDVSNPALPVHQSMLQNLQSGALIDAPTDVFVSGNYVYVTNSGRFNDLDIGYIYGPSISGYTPATGAVGASVTITGQNFNTLLNATINGLDVPVKSVSATSLVVTIPAGATIGPITLANGGLNLSTAGNFVVAPSTLPATLLQQASFTANWSDVGAANYFFTLRDKTGTVVTGYDSISVGAVTSYALTGLSSGATYRYSVYSSDGTTSSIKSNVTVVTTLPGTPTANAATAIGQNVFKANWTTVPNCVGYFIDVALDTAFNTFVGGYNNLMVNGGNNNALLISGLDAYTSYYYRVRSVNAAAQVSPSSNRISVLTYDIIPPTVTSGSNPTTVTQGNTPAFTAIFSDNVEVDTARIFYRGISKSKYNSALMQGPGGTGGTYTVTSQTSWYDSLGLEYYFSAVDEVGNTTNSPTSFIQLINPSITIPALPSGTDQKAYRIVSFPYVLATDNKVTSVYSGVPWNDRTQAGIWWWNPNTNNGSGSYDQYGDPNAFQTIDQGKGYWVITRTSTAPQLSNVPAPNFNRSNLYSLTLKPNWNLIGNPYPVPISWDDVEAFNQKSNPGTSFSHLNVYDGSGFTVASGSTLLNAFQGGFVKNLTGSDITLKIPFDGQTTPGGRLAAITSDISQQSWNVYVRITQNDFDNQLGGFGMNPDASIGVDRFDNYNPPQFLDNPELNFTHNGFPGLNFANDVVKTESSYTWRFTPSGKVGETAQLSWDKIPANTDLQLFLLDEELVQVIDMTSINHYDFTVSSASQFSIFFGRGIENKVMCSEIAAGNPYPNPVHGISKSTVALSLPESDSNYGITIQVYDLHGNLIQSENASRSSGIHQMEFALSAAEVPAGIYIYKLLVGSKESSKTFTGKILKL